MPLERICFTPHPVWGKTDAEMYAYLEGNDPVSGKPLMKEVIDALTRPLSAEEAENRHRSKSPPARPPTPIPPTRCSSIISTTE